MRPLLLQKLLSVCDRCSSGIFSLPNFTTLQQRLDSESADEIFQELSSFPGGVEEFARAYGLLLCSNAVNSVCSLKRPRSSSLAYSQVDTVRARSVAERQSSGVRQFLRVVDDRSVVESIRRRGMDRSEPIDFDPVRHSDALRAVENLPGSSFVSQARPFLRSPRRNVYRHSYAFFCLSPLFAPKRADQCRPQHWPSNVSHEV